MRKDSLGGGARGYGGRDGRMRGMHTTVKGKKTEENNTKVTSFGD